MTSKNKSRLVLVFAALYLAVAWLVFATVSERAGLALIWGFVPLALLLNPSVREHYRWELLLARLRRRRQGA